MFNFRNKRPPHKEPAVERPLRFRLSDKVKTIVGVEAVIVGTKVEGFDYMINYVDKNGVIRDLLCNESFLEIKSQ